MVDWQSRRGKMNMWRAPRRGLFLFMWASGVVWMLVAAGLPWAPTSGLSKGLALAAGSILALLCVLAGARVQWQQSAERRNRLKTLCLVTLGLVVTAAFIWMSLLDAYGTSYLDGEELRATFDDREHGREIFVYVRSVIPDGDKSSRVAVQQWPSPFERTMLEVDKVFLGFGERDATGLVLNFSNNTRARYQFADGKLQVDSVKPSGYESSTQ